MKSSIVIFDQFTDLDLFLMWDLLNRVRLPEWEVRILGERPHHTSDAAELGKLYAPVLSAHGKI